MTEPEALKWVTDLFQEPSIVGPDLPRDGVKAWDSLGVLILIAALDDDFDIAVSDEEVERMRRVGDILDVLRRNGKLNSKGSSASFASKPQRREARATRC